MDSPRRLPGAGPSSSRMRSESAASSSPSMANRPDRRRPIGGASRCGVRAVGSSELPRGRRWRRPAAQARRLDGRPARSVGAVPSCQNLRPGVRVAGQDPVVEAGRRLDDRQQPRSRRRPRRSSAACPSTPMSRRRGSRHRRDRRRGVRRRAASGRGRRPRPSRVTTTRTRDCRRARTARASPAKSTAPTIAASSSPRRSQSTAIAAAWIPEVSSQETVKLGPPIRNSRAIRLATRPPSEPIVRLAVSAGPAASRSSSIQPARSASESSRPSSRSHSRALVGQRPAEVEVGRVQVEPDADEDARPEGQPRVPAGVADRLGRDPEHQRLLRQHLPQLLGRDPELVDRELERADAPIRSGRLLLEHQASGMHPAPRIVPTWAARPTMAIGADPVAADGPRTPNAAATILGRPSILDQHMGIDAAEAEPADRGAAGLARSSLRPGLGAGRGRGTGCARARACGLACSKFAVGGSVRFFERQQDLEQARPRRPPSAHGRCSP